MRLRRHAHTSSRANLPDPATTHSALLSALRDTPVAGAGGQRLGRCVDLMLAVRRRLMSGALADRA